jgi:hypothetical protein
MAKTYKTITNPPQHLIAEYFIERHIKTQSLRELEVDDPSLAELSPAILFWKKWCETAPFGEVFDWIENRRPYSPYTIGERFRDDIRAGWLVTPVIERLFQTTGAWKTLSEDNRADLLAAGPTFQPTLFLEAMKEDRDLADAVLAAIWKDNTGPGRATTTWKEVREHGLARAINRLRSEAKSFQKLWITEHTPHSEALEAFLQVHEQSKTPSVALFLHQLTNSLYNATDTSGFDFLSDLVDQGWTVDLSWRDSPEGIQIQARAWGHVHQEQAGIAPENLKRYGALMRRAGFADPLCVLPLSEDVNATYYFDDRLLSDDQLVRETALYSQTLLNHPIMKDKVLHALLKRAIHHTGETGADPFTRAVQSGFDVRTLSYRHPMLALDENTEDNVQHLVDLCARAGVTLVFPAEGRERQDLEQVLYYLFQSQSLAFIEVWMKAGFDPCLHPHENGYAPLVHIQDGQEKNCFNALSRMIALQEKHHPDSLPNLLGGCHSDGDSPLHLAVRNLDLKSMVLLCGQGLDPNSTNKVGSTPAHHLMKKFSPKAAIQKKVESALFVLTEAGANLTLTDKQGRTPLAVAAKRATVPTLLALLGTLGSRALEQTNAKGQTIVDLLHGREDGQTVVASVEQAVLASATPAGHETPVAATPRRRL